MVQTSTMKTLKSSLPVSLFSSRSSNQSPLLFMAGIALQYCLKMHTQACYFLFHKWLIITPCSALCFFFLKKLFILYWGLAEYKCCNSFKWIVKGLSHTYICLTFSQTPFPSRLLHSIELYMCYTVGPSWSSILNIAVCTCPSQTP